eukprot:m.26725 g.26725  ORF g.26725 m.26725 type:complete len:50 (+) comp4648_c0_seq2:682-831(+)
MCFALLSAATVVHKAGLLCSADPAGKVWYMTLNWSGNLVDASSARGGGK